MALLTQAPKGTKDVLPSESGRWQYVETILRKTAADFGCREIRFPTFEHTELFERGVGGTTDVVQKEMYTFVDKGGRSISLRPEGTASVARSFVEHSLDAAGLPLKCYYIAPNFRYEKPQAGRLREHHQFGVEIFGPEGPDADAELISLADAFLRRLGITNITVNINSIGCPVCRKDYHKELYNYFADRKAELCPTCLDRLEKNPMRIIDCKSPVCSAIAKDAPKSIDHLCPDCNEHFEGFKTNLEALGVRYKVNPKIVRGLDYYTRTVFEFISEDIGAQGAVCAGGRYDGLIAEIGGKPMPGLGFGSGIERLMMVMEALGVNFPDDDSPAVFLAVIGEAAKKKAAELAHGLRTAGTSAEYDLMGRSLKAQMKYADRIKARYSIVIGDDEVASGKGRLKDMILGGEVEIALEADDIADKFGL